MAAKNDNSYLKVYSEFCSHDTYDNVFQASHILLITSLPGEGVRSFVMSLSVCLSVSVCSHTRNSKATRPNFSKLLCMLPVAVARSSSDGVAIC